MVAKLGLEPLQEGERVGGGPGKPGQHLAVVKTPDLASVVLHHDVAERHLAVSADGGPGRSPDGYNSCGVKLIHRTTPLLGRVGFPQSGRGWGESSLPADPLRTRVA